MHSPNDIMNIEFQIHQDIFNNNNRWDYMMLSSGTNQFPMPKMWRDCLIDELCCDYTYQLYVSPYGFGTVQQAILLYENFISTQGHFLNQSVKDNKLCMTIGSSQAATLIMDYLSQNGIEKNIILVGTNYSLYEMVAREYGLHIEELRSNNSFLPELSDLLERITCSDERDVYIFTHPNNPSGEQYTQNEFDLILDALKKRHCFAVFDQVCNWIITQNAPVLIESSITKADYWKKSVIINSFSKTESVPGMRIGYIYGNNLTIDYIFNRQCKLLMSVQSVPVLPIFFTMLFRCIFLNNKLLWNIFDQNKIIRLYRIMFYFTTSIPSQNVQTIIEYRFANLTTLYNTYINDILSNEKIIVENYEYLQTKLKNFLAGISTLQGGFNVMVCLKYTEKFTELEFVEKLLANTGIAILTESSFCIEKKNEPYFWFRISLACEKVCFQRAIDKLDEFMNSIKSSENRSRDDS